MPLPAGPWYYEPTGSLYAIVDREGFTIVNPSPLGEQGVRSFVAIPEAVEALRLCAKIDPYGDVANAAARDAAIAALAKLD